MRIVTWTIRLLVFVLLVAFGAKNADPVTLRFYFDLSIQTPLILALFGAFAAGTCRSTGGQIALTLPAQMR